MIKRFMREKESSERRMKLGDKRCELFVLIRPKKQNMPPSIPHYNPMGHFDQNTVPNFNTMHPNKFQNAPPPNAMFHPSNNQNPTFPNSNPNPNQRTPLFDNLKPMNMNQFHNNHNEMNPGQMMSQNQNQNMNNYMNKPQHFQNRPPPNQPNEFFNPSSQQFQNQNNPSKSMFLKQLKNKYNYRFLHGQQPKHDESTSPKLRQKASNDVFPQ